MKALPQLSKSVGPVASSTSTAQRKLGVTTIVNNRPAAIAQRKLQEVVQAKSGPGGVIQRNTDDESEGGIATRVSNRNARARMTPRERAMHDAQQRRQGGVDVEEARSTRFANSVSRQEQRRTEALENRRRDLWNGQTRPTFREQTLQDMLAQVNSYDRADGVTVYECNDGNYYPLKRDRIGKEDFATLDHHTNWKEYILDNAEAEEDGKISNTAARDAYNDQDNLVLMPHSLNSSKSGPKGVLD